MDDVPRAQWQAERLEALWRIVNTPDLRGNDLLLATLREAASVIRPGQAFAGSFGHIEGTTFVLDALAGDFGANGADARALLPLGMRIECSETLHARNLNAGRTQSWDDCQAVADLPPRARAAGVRSQITTHFIANGIVHALTLGSLEPPSPMPFNAQDHAYIELLGSFFARQLEREHLEDAHLAAERQARLHAERLERLWQIVNTPALRGESLVNAMLREGAASIRHGQMFRGILGRIDDADVVVVALGHEPDDDGAATALLPIGSRTPVTATRLPFIGRTQTWMDSRLLGESVPERGALGWRAAIRTRFVAAQATYQLMFASPEPATEPFGAEDLAYLDVIAAALAKQLEIDRLENTLREEDDSSRRHAERLEALWSIVNDPALHGAEKLDAMLEQVAGAIRPDQRFRATLWRIEGDDVVIEAVTEVSDPAVAFTTLPGSVIPLAETVVGKMLAGGCGTRSWNDILESGDACSLSHAHATRSFIATMFKAGSTQWGLVFTSTEKASRPFGPQDHVYVEVLASFFANHVQQRWQFERIQYQQSHDVLTGLLNRSHFRSEARAAARTMSDYAIVLIGVDAFREINHSFGNMIGDALLVEIGNALQARTLPGELVGRIGGDVFGIYVPNAHSTDAAIERTRAFADVFTLPFSTGDRDGTQFIARTASIGFAVAPRDSTVLDTVLAYADAALAAAKKSGHGSVVAYKAGMDGDAQRKALLRNELVDAIALDQFELYYQPHVELRSGTVTGCEALVRWNHPTRGVLLPSHFIPFAEQNGIIGAIDTWVMNHAFATANALAEAQPGMRVYFNLSGRQAGAASLVQSFIEAAERGVKLENIGVEVTETDAMRDIDATRRVCGALQRLNVCIAIDDFGTGYSSLSSLKQLPINVVKIDRSFVSGLAHDPHDGTIAETILSITERFGFESLAEGVETPEQLQWLREHGCRYVQGYAICRPLPYAAMMAWLAGREEFG